MISTINLLPYREARRLQRANRIMATWAGTALVTVVGLALIHFQFTGHLDDLNAQAQKNEAIIADLDKKLGEVKKIREIKKIIEAKLAIIKELKFKRNLPVHLIDEVVHAMPEKAWLKELQLQGTTLKLTGMAQSNAIVADLMDNLNASPYIENVKLGQVATASPTDKAKSFSLEADVAPPEANKPDNEKKGPEVNGSGI
ncbi:MAG: PilN domain-containing protein [Magnetococcus sp. THC-1_WYH]